MRGESAIKWPQIEEREIAKYFDPLNFLGKMFHVKRRWTATLVQGNKTRNGSERNRDGRNKRGSMPYRDQPTMSLYMPSLYTPSVRILFVLVVGCLLGGYAGAQSYPTVEPLQHTFDVPDVSKADVQLNIKSPEGKPLYKLQCHSPDYASADFNYSGDFECRLSSVPNNDTYSTLLTEDRDQTSDWDSRGRFFGASVRGACAAIPQFGATRNFMLRGMSLTLQISDPVFAEGGRLVSLRLRVTVRPDPGALRDIAEIVPFPKGEVAAQCKVPYYFMDPKKFSKDASL